MPAKRRQKTDRTKPPPQLARAHRALTLVAQAEQALRQAIDESLFAGGRLPSLVDLAEQLGVSRETVRLAAEHLQKEGLLLKQRRRGTFIRPAQSTLRLHPAPAKTIGYMQADYDATSARGEAVTRGQGSLMLEGAALEAGRGGCELLVHIATALELRAALEQMTHSTRLRGIVLASVAEEKLVRRLAGLKLPTVLVDHDLHLPQLTTLRTDSSGCARLGVEHLWSLGHRRIACAYWNQADLNPWFQRGYRHALHRVGGRPRGAWELPVELTPAGAESCLARLLALSPRPTALIAFNNPFAADLIAAAWRAGLRIPEELSVFGGGGEETIGLSCAQLDWRELGRESIRLLQGLFEGSAPQHKLAEYHLQPGRTTAPLPA